MKKAIALFLILLPLSLFGQSSSLRSIDDDFEYSMNVGYGSYLMLSLRDLQNSIIENEVLPLFKTSSFPPYLNYSFKFGRNREKSSSGIVGGLMSTGSRSSISDFSGYYASDINAVAYHVGIYNRYYGTSFKLLNQHLVSGFSFNMSIIYSNITTSDNLRLYNYEGEDVDHLESFRFNSFGLYTEPSFFVQHMFSRHVGVELNVGGAVCFSMPLYYESLANDLMLNGKHRFANWSGLRVSIGVISVF